MEYCYLVSSNYLDILNKLQKRVCRTASPSLTASLELLPHRRNLARLSLFYKYCLDRCSSELLNWFCFLTFLCKIFLSLVLDVIRMPMSTFSYLIQLDSGIICLLDAFLRHLDMFSLE